MSDSSQKFIGRNRPPRVQIEYETEAYGSEKKVELPFVLGVMSDLSGDRDKDAPMKSVADRKFTKVDAENFDAFMKAQSPRVAFRAKNKLSAGGDDLPVELKFNTLADFTPARVAQNHPQLRELLDARTQLANLLSYMDGKVGAEELIQKLLKDPALLKALGSRPKEQGEAAAIEAPKG